MFLYAYLVYGTEKKLLFFGRLFIQIFLLCYRAAERKRGEDNFEIYVLLTQF